MYNATTKVKTFQPILDKAKGAVCLKAQEAFYDIVIDLNENTQNALSSEEVNTLAENLSKLFGIEEWTDGVYPVMDEFYQIKVHTYQQSQLDEMKEFDGY